MQKGCIAFIEVNLSNEENKLNLLKKISGVARTFGATTE